jgi:L-alanine-DL-glutamate epimerase-like enolase superfamily enzyme
VKITDIQSFLVDGGPRPWTYVKISTDDGILGWGECSNSLNPRGVVGTIADLRELLIGKDPTVLSLRLSEMYHATHQNHGGIAATAIAGLELAMLDIKAKALGISVGELFGGPLRERVRLYWSHLATSRMFLHELRPEPAPTNRQEFVDIACEAVEAGFTALKTNLWLPGNKPEVLRPVHGRGSGATDRSISAEELEQATCLIASLREALGPYVEIALDVAANFWPLATSRLARAMEPYDLMWLEVDNIQPDPLRILRQSTATPIATGENLRHLSGFLPYFAAEAADVYLVDAMWNGFTQAKGIGDLAAVFNLRVSPHNPKSHLGTFIGLNLSAVLPNADILEYDVEDVPWRDELTTVNPEIVDGWMTVPHGPGWGTDVNEAVAIGRPWRGAV